MLVFGGVYPYSYYIFILLIEVSGLATSNRRTSAEGKLRSLVQTTEHLDGNRSQDVRESQEDVQMSR